MVVQALYWGHGSSLYYSVCSAECSKFFVIQKHRKRWPSLTTTPPLPVPPKLLPLSQPHDLGSIYARVFSAPQVPAKAQGEVRGEGNALMGVLPVALHSSMAQGLAALEHATKNDLNAGRRAQAPDPAVLVLAFDVARLILVSARLATGLLQDRVAPKVWEPQPDPGL